MPPKGFFRSLFDFSFTSLVTTKVIRVIYALSLIFVPLLFVLGTAVAFKRSPALGALTLLVIAPVISLAFIVWVRMTLEFSIVLFRVMETNVELVWLKRQELGIFDQSEFPPAGSPEVHAPSGPQPAAEPVRYQVGDVVNGHRFNGAAWIPVEAH